MIPAGISSLAASPGADSVRRSCDLAGRGFAYTAAYDAQIAASLMAAELRRRCS